MFPDLVLLIFRVTACPTCCRICSEKWGLQMIGRSSQALHNQKNQHLMWRHIATINSHSLVLHQCNQLLLGARTQRTPQHTSYGRHQTYSIVRRRGVQTTLATFQKDFFPSLASCPRVSKQIACLIWWLYELSIARYCAVLALGRQWDSASEKGFWQISPLFLSLLLARFTRSGLIRPNAFLQLLRLENFNSYMYFRLLD